MQIDSMGESRKFDIAAVSNEKPSFGTQVKNRFAAIWPYALAGGVAVAAAIAYSWSSARRFTLVEQQECGKGVDLSPETLAKIQRLMPDIVHWKDNPDIHWLSRGQTGVFSLKNENAELLFKHGRKNYFIDNSKTCKNNVLAHQTVRDGKLDLLAVPAATQIKFDSDGREYTLLVQQKQKFNDDESYQEDRYRNYAGKMNETLRQLTEFIAKTNFSDVAWRNVPIMDSDAVSLPPRLSLHDLDEMDSAVTGIFGGLGRGLLRLLPEEDFDVILSEARRLGIEDKDGAWERTGKNERIGTIRFNDDLRQFHQDRGIVGKEPIKVDLESLNLNLAEEDRALDGSTMTMKSLADFVISKINEGISNSSEKSALRGKRKVLLRDMDFGNYRLLGLGDDCFLSTKDSWMESILKALVEDKQIFQFSQNGHGYTVHA